MKNDKQQQLWDLCQKFIRNNRVRCPEATCKDCVYENAPELVGDIADIVGYFEEES